MNEIFLGNGQFYVELLLVCPQLYCITTVLPLVQSWTLNFHLLLLFWARNKISEMMIF